MAPRSDASSSCSPARSRSRSRSRSKSRSPTPRRSPVRDTDSEAGRPTSRRQLSPRSPSRTLSRGRSRSRSGSPHPRHQSGDGRSRSRSFRPPSRSRPRSHSRSHSPAHAPLRSPTPAVPEPSATDKIEQNEAAKQAALKVEYQKLMDLRSGGTYIPPARLRALQAQLGQDDSEESKRIQQKFHWEALKKAINGLINKCNVSNIKHIVPELFEENLVRGRGLLCRSLMKAQAASLGFTPVFAVLAAAVNSRLPQVGELLVSRLILQFRKAFKRNDKKVCLASTTFLAHLTNQQVVHEFVALQILLLLLNKPTDDSVEIAVGFMKEVGEFLSDMQPRPVMLVWDRFREILHEGEIDKRVQYAVEVLFQIRKDNFRDNPAIKEELDIMEEEDMITHKLSLDDDDLKTQDNLNIFKFDPDFEASEAAYKRLKAEILGEASGSEDDDDDDEDESSDEEEGEEKQMEIKDQSNADLVNLRRTIYLTIKSSMDPEEAVHKLIRVKIPAGLEHELPSMVMECCAQEHTYQKFFGLIGERFAKLNRMWTDLFENQFATTFETIHRFETNRLRNVARFFGHMFAFDALGWHIFNVINLNEEETTASSRIFIKILFQDIAEIIGMKKLRERLEDPNMQEYYEGIFPKDNARNVRFSINYFTSIGMGPITESMREYLVNMPKPALPAIPAIDYSDGESVSSYSSYSSRSRSRSRSITPKNRGRSHSRTHSRSISVDSRSRSRSRSYSRSPPRSRSRTPKRARRRSYSRSRSRSYSRSPSRSRSRPRSRSPVTTKSKSTASSSRRHNGSYSRSRNHGRGRSVSYDSRRSGSRSRSRSISRSKSPVVRKQSGKGRRRSPSSSRSHSRLRSRSRTPVRNSASGKRRRAASPSKSPSPPPSKRGRR